MKAPCGGGANTLLGVWSLTEEVSIHTEWFYYNIFLDTVVFYNSTLTISLFFDSFLPVVCVSNSVITGMWLGDKCTFKSLSFFVFTISEETGSRLPAPWRPNCEDKGHREDEWVFFRAWWNLCGDQISSEPLSCSPLYLQHSHQHHLDRSMQIRNPLHELVFFQPLHDDGQDDWPGGGGWERVRAEGEVNVAKGPFEERSVMFTHSFLVQPWWFGRWPPERCPSLPLAATETNTHRAH